MRGKLEFIRDWESRARRAGYDLSKLALICGVSKRRLQQHFHRRFGICPHHWLVWVRFNDGMLHLPEDITVKEAANQLGFRHVPNFCRLFKKLFGLPPGAFLRGKRSSPPQISFFDNCVSLFGHFVSQNDNKLCSLQTEGTASNIADILPFPYENAATSDLTGRQHHTLGTTNPTAGRRPRRP